MKKSMYGLFIGLFLGVFIITGYANAGPPEQQKIQILSTRSGQGGYVLSFALSDIINKTSPWLRAEVLETKGSGANTKTLALEPNMRPTSVIFGGAIVSALAERGKLPGQKEKYTTLKMLSLMFYGPTLLMTPDPKIKTINDLVGKKVAIPPPGTTFYFAWEYVLKGLGLWDKMKIQHAGTIQVVKALGDGLINAGLVGLIDLGAQNCAMPPYVEELMAAKKMYPVQFSKELFDKAMRQGSQPPLPITWYELKPGVMGPTQPDPAGLICYSLGWAADLAMDNNTVYEIVKTIYENADKFKSYHASGGSIRRDTMSRIYELTEADFHPGAVKFYKEHNMQIGGK